jgi:hypothetical protein
LVAWCAVVIMIFVQAWWRWCHFRHLQQRFLASVWWNCWPHRV